jgi:nucleoside-diphosphate-sugar epimerase
MKILLTGSNGFIGRNIVELLGVKHEIIEVSRGTKSDISNLNSLLDINDVDIVIHAAAKTFIPDSFIDPYNFYKFNINSSLNVAEYCRVKKIHKLIYLNTYPYGNPDYCPVDEGHRISLHSPYNKSKYLSEKILFNYLEDVTNVVSLRLFNLYGKYQKHDFIVPHIIKQALESSNVVVKDLEPKRDYLYIKDMVSLIDIIINSNSANGIYNVGSGKSFSVGQVIDIIEDILNKPLNARASNVRRESEVMDCYADISRLKKDFDWTKQYSLKNGLTDYIKEIN